MTGTKEKRFATYPNRWSEGRVHRYVWDSLNRMWHVACRPPHQGDPHGRVVKSTSTVTCKKC